VVVNSAEHIVYTPLYSGRIDGGGSQFNGITSIPPPVPGQAFGNFSVTPYFYEYGFGAVPEPATWTMLLTGALGLGVVIRRRRHAALEGTEPAP
jgi:hypothetical protein